MKKTKRRKLNFRNISICLFALIAIVVLLGMQLNNSNNILDFHHANEQEIPTFTELEENFVLPSIDIPKTDLFCNNAILIDAEHGSVLFAKNENEHVYPASVTKVLAALVSLENIENLQDKVTLTAADFSGLYQVHASLSGFSEGEAVTYNDLLYSLLLVSGCDSAQALANNICGSMSKFAELMNKKIVDLGLSDSNFANASGLTNENHYTTANDMATVLASALKNKDSRDIITTEQYQSSPSNINGNGITLDNYFFWRMNNDFGGCTLSNNAVIKGGKTGYTSAAGLCLAAFAEKDGHEYIAVVLGDPGDSSTQQFNFIDVIHLFEQL